MTAQELAAMLTEAGLPADQITGLVNNAKFQERAGQLAQKQELDAINTAHQQLQTTAAQSKKYEDWYNKNYAALTDQAERVRVYNERYGPLEGQTQPGQTTTTTTQQQAAPQFTQTQIDAMIDARMTGKWGGEVSNSIVGTGKIVEMHMRNKRDGAIDWAKIRSLAEANGGNIELAYGEWDKPAKEAADKTALDALVESRVKQDVEKRMLALGTSSFPAGADYGSNTPSPLTPRQVDGVAKYDRNKVIEAANSVLSDPNYRSGLFRN